jgi:hypothetical protein
MQGIGIMSPYLHDLHGNRGSIRRRRQLHGSDKNPLRSCDRVRRTRSLTRANRCDSKDVQLVGRLANGIEVVRIVPTNLVDRCGREQAGVLGDRRCSVKVEHLQSRWLRQSRLVESISANRKKLA